MVFRFKPIYSHLPCVTWRDNIFLYQDIHSSSLLRAFLTQRQDMCEKRHVTVLCNLADEKRNLFHACQKLRFLRCIDVFMITISRFPAAEEHLSCSSAAGRHPSIQTPFCGLSVQARAGFLPRRWLDRTKPMPYASF